MSGLLDLLASRQPGRGLPRGFYHDEALYQAELDAIWRAGWLVAGHACQIPEPGDYFTYELAGDSVIVVRGDDGAIRGFHNTCRHRGSQICSATAGHVGRLVCPYHQWVYGRDGALVHARGMAEDFDRSQHGLAPAAVEEVGGLVFLSLADPAPNFAAARAALEPLLAPQGLNRAKVARAIDYVVPANWKLVWENNRECYHCNTNHPQYIKANFDHYNADDTDARVQTALAEATARSQAKWAACGLAVTHTETGMTLFPDVERDIWFSCNRTPLVDGYVSETMTGQQIAPLMGDYPDADVGTLRIRTLPNFWNHSSCDHSVSTQLLPSGLRETKVRVTWLVDAAAREGIDYQEADLLPFWQLTSEQDWELCEAAQKGIDSRAYRPGPLSPYKEYNVDGFLTWYVQKLKKTLRGERPASAG